MSITITLTDADALEYMKMSMGQALNLAMPQPPTQTPSFELPTPPVPPIAGDYGIEVDSRGLPWDGRIHTQARSKNPNGTWRAKRNVDDSLVKAVERELQVTMGVSPEPEPANVEVPPTNVEVPPTNVEVPPPPFALSAVPPAPPTNGTIDQPIEAGAAPGASHSDLTFPQVMKAVTAGFTNGTINQPMVQQAVQSIGLTNLPMLANRPDLLPQFVTALGLAL